MKIKLHEIPEEGKEYTFNRNTAELNDSLEDLIHNSGYDIRVHIKPLTTKNYEVRGSVNTATDELCSLCGDAFKFKVNARLHEILVPALHEAKNNQFSKSNHVSELKEDGPGVTEYSNDIFDLGEYLHEAIALTIPFNPKHDINDPACKTAVKSSDKNAFIYDEKMSEEKKSNAFDVLKGLKIN